MMPFRNQKMTDGIVVREGSIDSGDHEKTLFKSFGYDIRFLPTFHRRVGS